MIIHKNSHTIKNVALLASCQAITITGNIVIFSVSVLAALHILADKSLATIPLFIQYATGTLTTFLASFIMKRYGRKTGFIFVSQAYSREFV